MVTTVRSLGLTGIAGYEVAAECFLSGGLPAFDIVGLPDAAVREARERVRAAVKNCGAKFPVSRITVNLAPAGTKKAGTVCSPLTGVTSNSWDTPAGHRVYDACRGFSVSWVCRGSGASGVSSASC